MKDKMNYNGFIASVHFDSDDNLFYGKIDGISDIVTFEGESVEKLRTAFAEACNDYLEICKQVNKRPLKSFKGSLNIKLTPELHQRISEQANHLGIPLNSFIQKTLEHELYQYQNTSSRNPAM